MKNKKDLAIIGANEFQVPLILKAKALGYTTHVFAWQCDDWGEFEADYFYPISIVEKERILEVCKKIRPVGVLSIGSDLASLTVNYVAQELGLTGNGMDSALTATNKHLMRRAFQQAGLPSCRSCLVASAREAIELGFRFPFIIKPTDRSGSRGIFLVKDEAELSKAIASARDHSFEGKVLAEDFIPGKEYSVEYISWQGRHHFLACTEKATTGAPMFIESGHLQPPLHLSHSSLEKIQALVPQMLDCLGVKNGASHTELKIDSRGDIRLIECGARMGGDCIGSDLVYISQGIDFVAACIDVACGREPDLSPKHGKAVAAIRFIFSSEDLERMEQIRRSSPQSIAHISYIEAIDGRLVSDSSQRYGFYIMQAPDMEAMQQLLELSKLELKEEDK